MGFEPTTLRDLVGRSPEDALTTELLETLRNVFYIVGKPFIFLKAFNILLKLIVVRHQHSPMVYSTYKADLLQSKQNAWPYL